jgi:nucleoid DNA-binding protein
MSTKASDLLIEQIANKYKLDKRVVAHIVRYPFLFTTNVFKDENDYTPIMLRHLGKYVIRYKAVKKGENDTQRKDIRRVDSDEASLDKGLDISRQHKGKSIQE